MTHHQNIHGDVGQVLQAQSVSQLHAVVQLPERRPESQLQAEFAQRTGIWCPKPAREWLEFLMEHHSFTARELAVSWKAGSIGWSARNDAKHISTPWLEAAFAYCALVALGLYCLVMVVLLIWTSPSGHPLVIPAVIGFAVIYLGIYWMANHFMLWPRRVALRVLRHESESVPGV